MISNNSLSKSMCVSYLQSSNMSHDGRLTVVRPSFDCRSTMLKLCSILVIVLTVGVGNAWGATSTSITSYADGTYFLIDSCDGRYYAMSGVVTSKKIVSVDITSNVTLNLNGTITVNATGLADALQYTLSHSNTTYTITANAVSNNGVMQATGGNDLVTSGGNSWGLATHVSFPGRFSFTSSYTKKSTTNTCLLFQSQSQGSATKFFKGYAASNRNVRNPSAQSYAAGYFWLVPVPPACTPLASINGSIFLSKGKSLFRTFI